MVLQISVAVAMSGQSWWVVLPVAYFVGAFVQHHLNIVIHEAGHDFVFPRTAQNKAFALFANLTAGLPSAIAFRYYHSLHHRYLGQRPQDADVPPAWEARLIGRGWVGKLLWLLLQPLTYGVIHPLQVSPRIRIDAWLLANVAASLTAAAAIYWFLGPASLAYILLSTYFAVGPHPTGAHILQEHIIFSGRYETASYYGPINRLSINAGYHLEHHDFPGIPGPRLPTFRRIADRHYAGLYHHRSRIKTM
ncbi:MAG: fatty acid desaturase, partial [Stellaceae bacterium]